MRIKAFKALRPSPENARLVASVPYDTVNTEEARTLAENNELSFLHVVRPEIDLPDGTDIHSDQVYDKAAENLAKFQENKTLIREDTPCLYVYRQKMGGHVQRGIVDPARRKVLPRH